MNVSPRKLLAFVTLAQSLSFSRTANHLHVTQPALSKMVRDLEGEFGVRLFDRSTRSVQLSSEGKKFLVIATRLLEEYDCGIAELKRVASDKHQRLAIAALPSVVAGPLLDAISAHQSERPQANVKIYDVQLEAAMDLLHSKRVDLAITSNNSTLPEFRYEELLRDPLVLVTSATHPWFPSTLTWSDVVSSEVPIITLPKGSGIRQCIDMAYLNVGKKFQPQFELNQMSSIAAFVRHGLGVGILPLLAAHLLADDDIQAVHVSNAPVRTLEVVQMRNRQHSENLDKFLETLKRAAKRWSEFPARGCVVLGRRQLTRSSATTVPPRGQYDLIV